MLQDFAEALSRECGSYDMTCLEAGEQEAETLRRRLVFRLVQPVSRALVSPVEKSVQEEEETPMRTCLSVYFRASCFLLHSNLTWPN